jgi:sirohydrochlorin cobaltochelatase
MKTIVVFATHGAPPRGFPKGEMAEWFRLHGRMEHAGAAERAEQERRYAELDERMRAWPRTPENDPFHASSLQMAASSAKPRDCRCWSALTSSVRPAWTMR